MPRTFTSRLAIVVSLICLPGFTCSCSRPGTRETAPLAIAAAASLQDVLGELCPAFEQTVPGLRTSLNFGGSGTLARQIEQGAPTDVFLSAAPKPMDAVAAKGLILPDTRCDLLRGDIVLIVPKDSKSPSTFADLSDPAIKLIALGEPGSVPAGEYGRQVLQSLRLWDAVQPRLVLAKDARQVMNYVETGNADAGIVYATDAHASANVRIAAVAGESTHDPVLYPPAVIRDARNIPAARAFLAFLKSERARAIFVRHGFRTAFP